MNESRFSPDDPRLTAYALGELEGEARAAVEAVLQHDPAARAVVEQTRRFAEQMTIALANEPDVDTTGLAPAREPVMPEFKSAKMPEYEERGPKFLRFPQLYFVVGGLAAASFALMVALRAPNAPASADQQIALQPSSSSVGVTSPKPPAAEAGEAIAKAATHSAETTSSMTLAGADAPPRALANDGHPLGSDATVASAENPASKDTEPASSAPSPAVGSATKPAAAPASARGIASDATPARTDHTGSPSGELAHPLAEGLANASRSADEALVIKVPPFLFATAAPNTFAPPNTIPGNRASADLSGTVSAMALPRFNSTLEGEVGSEPAAATVASGPIVLPNSGEVLSAVRAPLALVPIPTDNGSYAIIRHAIATGKLPARDEVRIEELLNAEETTSAFRPVKTSTAEAVPVAAAMEIGEAPWAPRHRLVRIALTAAALADARAGDVVAKDVRVEVEFNPRRVATYRLIGYARPTQAADQAVAAVPETGALAAGRIVTALLEIVPVVEQSAETADEGYGPVRHLVTEERSRSPAQLLTLRVQYRATDTDRRHKLVVPLVDNGGTFVAASGDFKFAAAVASYGMVLRDSPFRGRATLDNAIAWASASLATARPEEERARTDFIDLMRRTRPLLR